jgi:hypothetical protein
MIPCSNIAYTANRAIPNLRATSDTETRLFSHPTGGALGVIASGIEPAGYQFSSARFSWV